MSPVDSPSWSLLRSLLVREDADHAGTTANLLVEALEGVGGVNLPVVRLREGQVGEHVVLGVAQQLGGGRVAMWLRGRWKGSGDD